MVKSVACFLITSVISSFIGIQAQGLNIRGGHSHNDYSRDHPLTDAISNGLISVEADVFPIHNTLLVAHSLTELKKENTLEKLYFAPLEQMAINHTIKHIILLIDIKSESEKSYQLLKVLFNKYAFMLTQFTPDSIKLNTVTVILSGERPLSLLSEQNRLAALDGRFDEISFKMGCTYFPLISDNRNNLFKWNGDTAISTEEELKLEDLVSKCHNQHKLIRFWGLPFNTRETIEFWKTFQSAGVDLLGVDSPSMFKSFEQKAI